MLRSSSVSALADDDDDIDDDDALTLALAPALAPTFAARATCAACRRWWSICKCCPANAKNDEKPSGGGEDERLR